MPTIWFSRCFRLPFLDDLPNIWQNVAELFRPNRFGTKTEPKCVPKIYLQSEKGQILIIFLQFNFLGAFVSLIWKTFKNIGQDVTELFRLNRFGTKTEPKFVPKIYCKRGRAAGYLWTRKWTSWQRKSSSQFCLRPVEHPYIRLQV